MRRSLLILLVLPLLLTACGRDGGGGSDNGGEGGKKPSPEHPTPPPPALAKVPEELVLEIHQTLKAQSAEFAPEAWSALSGWKLYQFLVQRYRLDESEIEKPISRRLFLKLHALLHDASGAVHETIDTKLVVRELRHDYLDYLKGEK